MYSQNTWIIAIVLIVLAAIFWTTKENYCGCSGMLERTPRPTYYVYRPFGDVSDYATATGPYGAGPGGCENVGAETPVLPMQNLGWKTGMPYDAFVSSLNTNSWAAGSDPDWQNHSSVPFLQMNEKVAGQFADAKRNNDGLSGGNGGYAQNYGTTCNGKQITANSMTTLQSAPCGTQSFVTGMYGYPNMLSSGLPEITGPAGSFESKPCATANAYNLGVGVL